VKTSRFSESQIVAILREAEATEATVAAILREAEATEATVAAICHAHGISENTFYRWRKRYGSMEISEVRRLRELEGENARLKRLLAERDLEIDAIREALRGT